jgi:hypothetical protein
MWEFVCNTKAVPKATSGVFEVTVLQCMYERVSSRGSTPYSYEDC